MGTRGTPNNGRVEVRKSLIVRHLFPCGYGFLVGMATRSSNVEINMSQPPIVESIESLELGSRSGLPLRSGPPAKLLGPAVANDKQLLKFPTGKHAGDPLKVDRRRNSSPPGVAPTEALDQLSTLARRQAARIAIKAKGRFVFVFLADIVAIEAKGNYVLLHHTSNSHFLRESISMMEHRFSPYGFVRIHRSALVNAALVEEIQPWSTGEYVLRVRGGREYTVTRTYKHNLHRLAACWLGGEGFCPDRSSVPPDISARVCL